MITHFIKIAKRLNELHSFNSLMAIVVALKSAPIFRLRKTWTQHVSKRDQSQFERMADVMFDTSDNKRKIRDMHMNCKLPCIPFLGLFLTDLIHIDIAHPHNSFDNPQRRNQMNNICRLVSEYQQSNYQDTSSLECMCCFTSPPNPPPPSASNIDVDINVSSSVGADAIQSNDNDTNEICITTNCNCAIHHGNNYGGGIINSDGTIYINEIKYVQNYLNSFLYIEELQKFKEDENYRDSLELEPESPAPGAQNSSSSSSSTSSPLISYLYHNSSSSPNKLANQQTSSSHRKTLSLATSLFAAGNNHNNQLNGTNVMNCTTPGNMNLLDETKQYINDYKTQRHHPLDDSLVESCKPTTLNICPPIDHSWVIIT